MSQIQSEVRPNVLQMPHTGFIMQTGGSARKRIIKPTIPQTSTTSLPIQTHYRVAGVPGHTHNSSAVLSVLCDLKRKRGADVVGPAGLWSENEMKMTEDSPGDSEIDADARFDRALERGIGEICLRPENCHQEIREPVRSIAEIRTLVAPDDRLQTLTYVEEVGGFVNPDGSTFISDFPDVYVNILGINDPGRLGPNDGDTFRLEDIQCTPRLEHGGQTQDGTILITRQQLISVGDLEDGSGWDGVVRFRWNAEDFVYRSEGFYVTLDECKEIQRFTTDAVTSVVANFDDELRIYVKPIETTRAYNGSCFLCKDGLTNNQVFSSSNGASLMPRFDVDVLGPVPSNVLRSTSW